MLPVYALSQLSSESKNNSHYSKKKFQGLVSIKH